MVKKISTKKKYKAVDTARFKESFNDTVPCYEKLSKGDEVNLDPNNKHTTNWLINNFLKEVK
ncbi:hypothetical protein CMI37_18650 [Candidatus Pacearchaeota archaeon]|nr:hypothetical protein [Candidatus Pacearchaeota archaeon]|tara:strand:+ start:3164 stop:3349 length:186 start_codon:yes stop_codon:yes gene_type:complete